LQDALQLLLVLSTDMVLKRYSGFDQNEKLEADDFLKDIRKWCEGRLSYEFLCRQGL